MQTLTISPVAAWNWASGLSYDDAAATPFLAYGTHDEIAEHLRQCRQRWGISYFSVRSIDEFQPVIERLRPVERFS